MGLIDIIKAGADTDELSGKLLDQLGAPTLAVIADLQIDCVSEEQHNESYEVIDRAIEGNVTDHVHKLPPYVTIIGILTDNEFSPLGMIQQVRGGGISLTSAADKLLHLQKIHRDRDIIDIDTDFEFYNTFIIQEFSVIRTFEKSKAVFFTLTAKHVKIVSSQNIEFNPKLIPKEKVEKLKDKKHEKPIDKSKPPVDKGEVEKVPVKEKSLAATAVDWVAGLGK